MKTHTREESVSKQRIHKQTTIGVLLETLLPVQSMQNDYKDEFS
jgi:hypothetical protein